MTARDVSVVLPTYDERDTVGGVVDRLDRALGERLLEIVVVDDDSPDGTAAVVEELKHPRVRLIRRAGERGLASALARGTSEAAGAFVAWLDCDLGVPPEIVARLVAALEKEGADAAVASRYAPGGEDRRPAARAWSSRAFNALARALLGGPVRDYTSGVAAVRREALRETPLRASGFGEYFIDWAYRSAAKGRRVVEVAYVYEQRPAGYSKAGGLLPFARLGAQYTVHLLKTWGGAFS